MQLVIQRYTREAGVRSLERNLAALARAAAVRVAEQEVVPLSKGVEGLTTPLLENRLVDSAEVEMEVIPMGVNNRDISNTFRITSPLVVDEAMVEKVLGVISMQISACFQFKLQKLPISKNKTKKQKSDKLNSIKNCWLSLSNWNLQL